MRDRKRLEIFSRPITAATVFLLLVAAFGCEDDSPAGADTSAATLSEARITVNGQSLDGQAIRNGEHDGAVRFEARLTGAQGAPVSDHRVRVRVETPGGMGSMHHHMDEFFCYDDGTHGDLTPGDGLYCYEDGNQEYGCHRADAQPGDYHYDFCGVDAHGHESNHMAMSVSLLP